MIEENEPRITIDGDWIRRIAQVRSAGSCEATSALRMAYAATKALRR